MARRKPKFNHDTTLDDRETAVLGVAWQCLLDSRVDYPKFTELVGYTDARAAQDDLRNIKNKIWSIFNALVAAAKHNPSEVYYPESTFTAPLNAPGSAGTNIEIGGAAGDRGILANGEYDDDNDEGGEGPSQAGDTDTAQAPLSPQAGATKAKKAVTFNELTEGGVYCRYLPGPPTPPPPPQTRISFVSELKSIDDDAAAGEAAETDEAFWAQGTDEEEEEEEADDASDRDFEADENDDDDLDEEEEEVPAEDELNDPEEFPTLLKKSPDKPGSSVSKRAGTPAPGKTGRAGKGKKRKAELAKWKDRAVAAKRPKTRSSSS